MNITVIGDGSWGTALALMLHGNGHVIKIWSAFPENAAAIIENRENRTFLPGIPIPSEIKVVSDLELAIEGAEMAVLAIPIQYLSSVLSKLSQLPAASSVLLVNVAKGIELESCRRPSEIIRHHLGQVNICTLSGPSHAEEVARCVPTAVTVASDDEKRAKTVRNIFMNDFFRVYTTPDIIGVELGGALKNVYAIAAGICDGMKLGDNSKAALLTRTIAEMSRLGEKLGGAPETFAGLAGIGDLLVTCNSRHSRNHKVGEYLAQGKKQDEIKKIMGQSVAEGVKTTLSAGKLAEQKKVSSPILEQVKQVLYFDKPPRQTISDLMNREPRSELD